MNAHRFFLVYVITVSFFCYSQDPSLLPFSVEVQQYISQAQSWSEQQEHQKAIDCYKKAIELDTDSAQLYCDLGMCYYKKHDFVRAIESCKKALALDKQFVPAYITLGKVCTKKQKYNESLKFYRKALEMKILKPLKG